MLRYVRALLPAVWLAVFGVPATAQVAQDGQLWFNTTLFGSVDRFAYFAEIQPRFGEGISQRDQLILRPAIGWQMREGLKVYQGYARVETTPRGLPAFTEDRSFQQVDWEIGRLAGVKVSSRTRFEQRRQSDGRDTGFRLREFLRFVRPLTEAEGSIAALAWSEVFVSLNDTDWGARAGLDRVRTFVGFEIPLGRQDGGRNATRTMGKSAIEVGYMNQTVNLPGAAVGVDHVLSLSLFLRP